MSPSIFTKILRRPLLLICAAILMNANTGVAADNSGDFLAQTRDLLSGNVSRTGSVEKPHTVSVNRRQKSDSDVQEQAREVILGRLKSDGVVNERVSARRDGLVHTDLQESLRRMILGAESSGGKSNSTRLSAIQKAKQ